jgi:hypothetical protein
MPSSPSAEMHAATHAALRNGEHQQRSFLDGLELKFGPIPLFGTFLLEADAYLRRHGILLSFGNIAAITSTNAKNSNSWGRFAPQLDSGIVKLSDAESYCLVGHSPLGSVVAIQGGRIYDTGPRTLHDIAHDRTMYYGDEKPPLDGYTCTLTAPSAHLISNRYVYSGGLWVHPNYRGAKLAALLPRMSRVYAMSLWNTNYTYAFIGEKMANSPLLGLYGYRSVEPLYVVKENGNPFYTGYLMWMGREELIQDISNFMSSGFLEADAQVGNRGRDHIHRAAG